MLKGRGRGKSWKKAWHCRGDKDGIERREITGRERGRGVRVKRRANKVGDFTSEPLQPSCVMRSLHVCVAAFRVQGWEFPMVKRQPRRRWVLYLVCKKKRKKYHGKGYSKWRDKVNSHNNVFPERERCCRCEQMAT